MNPGPKSLKISSGQAMAHGLNHKEIFRSRTASTKAIFNKQILIYIEVVRLVIKLEDDGSPNSSCFPQPQLSIS
jgi:hypothetical protein